MKKLKLYGAGSSNSRLYYILEKRQDFFSFFVNFLINCGFKDNPYKDDYTDKFPKIENFADTVDNFVNKKYEGLKSLFFLNSNLGWIVGNEILVNTVNGGRNWTASTIENYKGFNFIHFVDEKNGWILGDNGLILKTGTSGVSWKAQDNGTIEALLSGIFLDARSGWAVGDRGTILKMLVIDG